MLQPKRTKYRKQFKGRNTGLAQRGSTVAFGEFGLKATERARMTAREIEAARRAMARAVKRGGQIWVRVFPDVPVSKKPLEVRMGSDIGQLGWQLQGSWVVQLSGDGLALLLVWVVMISIYGFAWVRPRRMWRAVIRGSLLAVLGIAVLTQLAFLVVGRTLSNPVYGALAVAAALLLLLYFASTIVMYCACWVAVREGAPEPVEQHAYFGRTKGGGVDLPVTAAAGSVVVDDVSSGERPTTPPDKPPG
jgi:large subunit ribosomal protein L16